MAKGDRTQASQSNQNNGPSLGWGNQSNNNSNSNQQNNNQSNNNQSIGQAKNPFLNPILPGDPRYAPYDPSQATDQGPNAWGGWTPQGGFHSTPGYINEGTASRNDPNAITANVNNPNTWQGILIGGNNGFDQNMRGIIGNYNNFANRPNYGDWRAQPIRHNPMMPQMNNQFVNPRMSNIMQLGMMGQLQGGNIMARPPQLAPSSDIWAPVNMWNPQAIDARKAALANDPNYDPRHAWT